MIILFIHYFHILIPMYGVSTGKFPVNIIHSLRNHSIIFLLQAYTSILMQILNDFDPPKRVHHITVSFAISCWFIENKSNFEICFSLIISSTHT